MIFLSAIRKTVIDVKVKICGLNSAEAVEASVSSGCSYIGCCFNQSSINYITPLVAREITADVPKTVHKVAVVSNISDKDLSDIVFYFRPNFIQLDGNETPEYILLLKEKFNCKVIKTMYITSKKDLEEINKFIDLVDMFMFQPNPSYIEKYNNNSKFFDWNILLNIRIDIPWMISGNILKHNLERIIRSSKARIISVSTSLESPIGHKQQILIHSFMEHLKNFCEHEPDLD